MTEKELNIDLPTDQEGFLPRQCPNCDQKFSIHADTYEQEHYLNLRCPYCDWFEEFDEFLTEEQAEYAEAVAENVARRMMEDKISEVFDDAFTGSSSDFVEIETNTDEIDFGERNAPSPQLPINTNLLECEECEFRYKISGTGDDCSCPVCR